MTLTLNGYDALKDLNLLISEITRAPLGMPLRRHGSLVIPGRPGATRTVVDPEEPPRDIQLTGILRGTSVANLRSNFDRLMAVLAADPLRLIFSDEADKHIDVVTTSVDPSSSVYFVNRHARVNVSFLAHFPYRLTTLASAVGAIGNADVAIPLGTAPVRPALVISGAAVNPVITYKTSAGVTISSMGFTRSLAGGANKIHIDCDAMTIKDELGNNIIADLTSGDFPILDAIKHGDFLTSAWPTLRCSSGSMDVSYYKAWR